MQTSYRFLSRLHLQYHTYNPSRNRDLRFLITLNTNDNFTPKFRRFSSRSFFSCNRRSGLSSLVKEREAAHPPIRYFSQQGFITRPKLAKTEISDHDSMRALKTGLCSFLVFSLKLGAWFVTSSHVLMAEVVHSFANFSDKLLHAYGLSSSRSNSRIAPWSFNIFNLAATVVSVRGILYLGTAQHPENIQYAAFVIGGSFIIEGASLLAAIQDVKKGAAREGVLVSHYIWHGYDPTSIDVLVKNVAAVTGLAIAGASLVAVNATGNADYDPIGAIAVGNLLAAVTAYLFVRNPHPLTGDRVMEKVLRLLKNDPVVMALYDCEGQVIGPGFFRVKAEIDLDGLVLVQKYLKVTGREAWTSQQFREVAKQNDYAAKLKLISSYGVDLVTSEIFEIGRLKNRIRQLVPGIRHVDIKRRGRTILNLN